MKRREITIVLGKTGFGKSYWTRQYLKGYRRGFLYDPVRETEGVTWYDDQTIMERYDNGSLQGEFFCATSDENTVNTFGNMAFLLGNCIFAVEEASLVFEKGARVEGWAKNIIFLGRHRNVSMLVTAQRAASIPIELRSQATRIVSFAQHESNDLQWLKDFYGERVEELPRLPHYVCLDSTDGEIKQYRVS